MRVQPSARACLSASSSSAPATPLPCHFDRTAMPRICPSPASARLHPIVPRASSWSMATRTFMTFNRFYTQKIGVLNERFLRSPFSLTEARVLFELAHRKNLTATEICAQLSLDRGYLSRILRKFARQRLVRKRDSPGDGRKSLLTL